MMFQKDGGILAYLSSPVIIITIFQRRLPVDVAQPLADAVLSMCQSLGWPGSPTRLEQFTQFEQEVKDQGEMLTEIQELHGLPEPLPPTAARPSP